MVLATNPPTVWDLGTGQVRNRLSGHDGAVLDVGFTPDAQFAITAGADSTVRLWDARTGAEKVTFLGHRGRVASVAVHPDGWCLASGGQTGGDSMVEPDSSSGSSGFGRKRRGNGLRRRRLAAKAGQYSRLAGSTRLDAPAITILPSDADDHGVTTPANLAAYSADSKSVAMVTRRRDEISVLDATTGDELAVLDGLAFPGWQVAISANGAVSPRWALRTCRKAPRARFASGMSPSVRACSLPARRPWRTRRGGPPQP